MDSSSKVDDRRAKRRFAIHRELRYKLLDGATIVAYGTGETLDMASGGVSFTTGQQLTLGAFIELSINWPALLEGTTPMRLVVYGRVLRNEYGSAVCTVDKYEFRTRAKTVDSRPPVHNDSIFQRWVDNYRKEAVRARASA